MLKHARIKRVLFLIDTRNLGEQAEQEFLAYSPSDDNRKFTELYSVQRLTAAQTAWLQLIRDHIMTSCRFERDDLDFAPFDAQGGLGKMHQIFGDQMDALIDELNGELVA